MGIPLLSLLFIVHYVYKIGRFNSYVILRLRKEKNFVSICRRILLNHYPAADGGQAAFNIRARK